MEHLFTLKDPNRCVVSFDYQTRDDNFIARLRLKDYCRFKCRTDYSFPSLDLLVVTPKMSDGVVSVAWNLLGQYCVFDTWIKEICFLYFINFEHIRIDEHKWINIK